MLNVNKGLKILIEDALVPVNYAINACTSNPARCLHVDDRKGTIGVGYDADLVVLDRDYEVVQTYCKGIGQKYYFEMLHASLFFLYRKLFIVILWYNYFKRRRFCVSFLRIKLR